MLVATGCAGAFGGYGPGQSNMDRLNTGCSQTGPMTATCTTTEYNSGERSFGAQIGLRTGAVTGSAGSISGTGFGLDAHADFTMAMPKWGVGLQFGYSNDQLSNDLFYWGVPVVAYGQYALHRRIIVHAGGGRVLKGSVRREEMSADASAWRGVGGISFVFARNARRDLALRFELRAQKSGAAQLGGVDATWSSTGLLAEIVYATF